MFPALRLAPLLALALASGAHGQPSPATVTPDRAAVLVNKDLNGQRWAIARDTANGTVTGNVFTPGSDEPSFVYCEQTGAADDRYLYDCYGTGRCAIPDCATDWRSLGQVALAQSFFATGAGPVPTPVPTPAPTPVRTPPPAGCPQNGPLTDLRASCSAYTYFYRAGVVIAAMSSTGSLAVVCLAGPTTEIICGRGPVRGATLADLTEANVDGSPFIPIGRGSSLRVAGQRIDVTFVLDERFDFSFTWFDTDTTSSLGVASYLPPRDR